MLEPKPPQPLPADVGLGGVTGQAVAYEPPSHHRKRGTAERVHAEPPAKSDHRRPKHEPAARRKPDKPATDVAAPASPAPAPTPPAPTYSPPPTPASAPQPSPPEPPSTQEESP